MEYLPYELVSLPDFHQPSTVYVCWNQRDPVAIFFKTSGIGFTKLSSIKGMIDKNHWKTRDGAAFVQCEYTPVI